MSTDLLTSGSDVRPHTPPVVVALGRVEARRLLRSPAYVALCVYLLVVLAVDGLVGGGESDDLATVQGLADLTGSVCTLFLGPLTFVAAHLVTSSARRSGAERLLVAAPSGARQRDLCLCLAVLIGPAAVALVIACAAAWLARGGLAVPAAVTQGTATTWSWVEVAQIPAIVLGAGVLGVVVARWLPFLGSLLLGFVAMVLATAALLADEGPTATGPWLAPYVAIRWWTGPWHPSASPVWHLVYLLALSALGVCAVALRHRGGRLPWLVGGCAAAAVVIAAGLLQLPDP